MDNQAAFLAEEDLVKELKAILKDEKVAADDRRLEGWAFLLSLGREVYLSSEKDKRELNQQHGVSIGPGEFALLLTEEKLSMPSHLAGFIAVRMKYKLKGLINVSGFHIDPNFQGHLVFAVYNAGPRPVYVKRGDQLFSMYLAYLSKPVKKENRDGAENQSIDGLKSKWITDIMSGHTLSLITLNKKVEEKIKGLETNFKNLDENLSRKYSNWFRLVGWLSGILAVVIASLIVWALTGGLKP